MLHRLRLVRPLRFAQRRGAGNPPPPVRHPPLRPLSTPPRSNGRAAPLAAAPHSRQAMQGHYRVVGAERLPVFLQPGGARIGLVAATSRVRLHQHIAYADKNGYWVELEEEATGLRGYTPINHVFDSVFVPDDGPGDGASAAVSPALRRLLPEALTGEVEQAPAAADVQLSSTAPPPPPPRQDPPPPSAHDEDAARNQRSPTPEPISSASLQEIIEAVEKALKRGDSENHGDAKPMPSLLQHRPDPDSVAFQIPDDFDGQPDSMPRPPPFSAPPPTRPLPPAPGVDSLSQATASKIKQLERMLLQRPVPVGAVRQALQDIPVAALPGPLVVEIAERFLELGHDLKHLVNQNAVAELISALTDAELVSDSHLVNSTITARLVGLAHTCAVGAHPFEVAHEKVARFPRCSKSGLAQMRTLFLDLSRRLLFAVEAQAHSDPAHFVHTAVQALTTASVFGQLTVDGLDPLCSRLCTVFQERPELLTAEVAQQLLILPTYLAECGLLLLPPLQPLPSAVARLWSLCLAALTPAAWTAIVKAQPVTSIGYLSVIGACIADLILPTQQGLSAEKLSVLLSLLAAPATPATPQAPPAQQTPVSVMNAVLWTLGNRKAALSASNSPPWTPEALAPLFTAALQQLEQVYRLYNVVPHQALASLVWAARVWGVTDLRIGHLPFAMRQPAMAGNAGSPFVGSIRYDAARVSSAYVHDLNVSLRRQKAPPSSIQLVAAQKATAEDQKVLRGIVYRREKKAKDEAWEEGEAEGEDDAAEMFASEMSAEKLVSEAVDELERGARATRASTPGLELTEDDIKKQEFLDNMAARAKKKDEKELQRIQLAQRRRTLELRLAQVKQARFLILGVLDQLQSSPSATLDRDTVMRDARRLWDEVASAAYSVEQAVAIDKPSPDQPKWGVWSAPAELTDKAKALQQQVVQWAAGICRQANQPDLTFRIEDFLQKHERSDMFLTEATTDTLLATLHSQCLFYGLQWDPAVNLKEQVARLSPKELKSVLQYLKLPASGAKATLVQRVMDVEGLTLAHVALLVQGRLYAHLVKAAKRPRKKAAEAAAADDDDEEEKQEAEGGEGQEQHADMAKFMRQMMRRS